MAESPIWKFVDGAGGLMVIVGGIICSLSQHNQVGWLVVGIVAIALGAIVAFFGLVGGFVDQRRKRPALEPSASGGIQIGTPSFLMGAPPENPQPMRVHFKTTGGKQREMTTPEPIAALRFILPREQNVRASELPKAVTGSGFPRPKIATVIHFGKDGGFTYACHKPDIELEAQVIPRLSEDGSSARSAATQDVRSPYLIVPVGEPSSTVVSRVGSLVRIEIENKGIGAQFDVTLEHVDGIEPDFADPHLHLHWSNHPDGNVVVEEIPKGARRPIAIGYLRRRSIGASDEGMLFSPITSSGEESGTRYSILPGRALLRVRIAVRHDPTIDYSVSLGVGIVWAGPLNPVTLEWVD